MSQHAPGGGGGAPPHLQDDRAPPDLDPAVVDKILNLVNAHLEAKWNFNNPADVIVEKLCLEENNKPGEQEPACSNGSSSSTETESPTVVQGGRLDHAPSDLDPAILDKIWRLDPAVLDGMLKLGPLILDQIRNQTARRFPAGECCMDRSSCKCKHPPRSEDKQNEFRSQGCEHGKAGTSNHSRGQPPVTSVGENFMGVPLHPNDFRSERHKNANVRASNHSREQTSVAPAGENFLGLPIRPGERKCPYYMQNGSCKYELSCKYNHPDPEAAEESHSISRYGNDWPAAFEGASPSIVEPSSAPRSLNKTPRYAPPKLRNQGEKICPYYMQNGSCKYGRCKYNHPNPEAAGESHPVSRYGNDWPATFQGASQSTVESSSAPRSLNKTPRYVPPQLRNQEEKKCPYYMQNDSCKYGLRCKYNHPDPEAAGESHLVSTYGNDWPAIFQGASSSTVEPSSAPISLNKTPRYVPPQLRNHEEKKCPYYMQNGFCKYGLSCKYNHPDLEATGESHSVSGYGNDWPATFQGASPSTVEPLSAPRSLNMTPRYVPPQLRNQNLKLT